MEGLCIDSSGHCVAITIGKMFNFKCSSDPLTEMIECNESAYCMQQNSNLCINFSTFNLLVKDSKCWCATGKCQATDGTCVELSEG